MSIGINRAMLNEWLASLANERQEKLDDLKMIEGAEVVIRKQMVQIIEQEAVELKKGRIEVNGEDKAPIELGSKRFA
jgi:hypothetical protein